MKKSLSMLLAVVMVFSIFTSAMVTVGAASAGDFLTVNKTDFVNDEITYNVVVKGGTTKLGAAIVKVKFDETVLEVVSAGAAGVKDTDDEITPNVAGIYVAGTEHNATDVYVIGFANTTGFTIGSDTEIFTITFRAISEIRPETTVEFVCKELTTDDEVDNDIDPTKEEPQSFFKDTFFTLSRPQLVAVDSVANVLRLEWSLCQGADYYNVYRKDASSTVWTKINADYVYDTNYEDATITQGVVYTYLVTAVNTFGETARVGTGMEGLNFGEIASCTANASENGITVTWSALAGADNYDVLRKETDQAEWEKVINVTGTTYEDVTAASGVEYNYSVRAHQGKYTAGMAVDAPVAKYIGKPGVAVSNIKDGLLLSITEVGGAEEYIVNKYVNGVSVGDFLTLTPADFTSGSYTYTDTDVQGDADYYYTAYAKAGSYVGFTTTCAVIKRLATPVLGTIENTAAGIKFTWSAVAGATKYNIYRKTDGAESYSYYTATSDTFFEIKAVENGKDYTFTIAAQNDTGCSSYNEAGLSIKRVNAPAEVSAITTNTGIRLTWSAVEGATSYIIYRKTGSGAYAELKKDVTDTSFVDETAQKNVQYTYVVKAKNGSYYSAYSAKEAQGMNFGTITSLTCTRISNGVSLQWNALANATSYRVYRKTANDTSFKLIKTVTNASSYDDTTIPSGVVCEYMVEAYNGANMAEMTAPALFVKYLSVPVVSARNSADKVRVTITAVYGAEKYIIERAVGTSTEYSPLVTLTDGVLEYIDGNNIIEGETYKYRVTAVAGDVSSYPGYATMTKLIAPKLTSCYNEIPGVQLKWTAIDGATSYIIYRKTPTETEWTQFAVTAKTEYVDASVIPNGVYQYTVEARTPDGDTGYDSVGRECRFLETPDLVSRANAVGGVTIKWNKVAGATSYRIYRRGAGTNYWYYLGDVPATKDTFLDKEGTAKSQIKSGNYYRYTVRASYVGQSSNGNPYTIYSGFDTEGLYLKYMASPKLTGISNAANGLYIKWNAVAGVTNGYRVYRRGAGATYWTYLGTVKTTYYTDPGVKNANGGYYRYTVIADGGYHSAFDTTGLYLKRLANPVLVSATSAKAGITVKWNKINGSNGYYIYRKTAGTTWTRIGTVSGVNKVTYLDKTAKKGVTYTYTVRAYSGKTLSSYNTKGISCKDKY